MCAIDLRYRYLCGGAVIAIGFGLMASQPVTAAPLGLGAPAILAAAEDSSLVTEVARRGVGVGRVGVGRVGVGRVGRVGVGRVGRVGIGRVGRVGGIGLAGAAAIGRSDWGGGGNWAGGWGPGGGGNWAGGWGPDGRWVSGWGDRYDYGFRRGFGAAAVGRAAVDNYDYGFRGAYRRF
jgi:hypothetical protein